MTKTRLIRKLTGVSTAICVALAGTVSVAAAPAPLDTVVYSVRDLSSENLSIIETTQADIENEQWNINALGDVSPEVYKDFPVQINSRVNERAQLNLHLRYLKNAGIEDSAILTITDTDTGFVYYEHSFSDDGIDADIINIPINKIYSVTLSETIDNVTEEYSGTLKTMYKNAEMPSNVYIGENPEFNSILADSVSFAEVSETDPEPITDSKGNIVADMINNPDITTIEPSQLASVYEALPSDKLYRIQTGAIDEGFYNHFEGFFSKKADYINLGIFVPAYSFSVNDENMAAVPMTLSVDSVSVMSVSHPMATVNEMITAHEYLYMYDEIFSIPNNSRSYVPIRFIFPETGTYTIETLGTLSTSAEYWSFDSENYPTYSRTIQGNGSNFSQTISVTAGQHRGWVIYLDEGYSGTGIFRITYHGFPNDRSNSIYEVSQSTSNRITAGTLYTDQLEYLQDVDVFYLNTSVVGKYGITVNNTSNADIDVIFNKKTSSAANPWALYTAYIDAGESYTYVVDTESSSEQYFASVFSDDYTLMGMYYTVKYISPDTGDAYEPNDFGTEAIDLINLVGMQGQINDLTLHRYDEDYFKFTTGAYGSNINATLSQANGTQYNLSLYTGDPTDLTLVTSSSNGILNVSNLNPSTIYYVGIDYGGLGSNAYSSLVPVTLTWQITNLSAQPSAKLSGDVAHTYSKDNTITSISDLTNAVMAKLTCYQRSFEIPDATAINDVALYYMNGSTETLLTAEAVNSLAAGSYPITVKYSGVAATGGTVTLTITPATEPEGEIVELANITTLDMPDDPVWDWISCAKAVANNRLIREGRSPSTKSIYDCLDDLIPDYDEQYVRYGIDYAKNAAEYFYDNVTTTTANITNFRRGTVNSTNAETLLLNKLNNEQAVIMLLTSATDSTNLANARYVVLCGINTINHTYKVADPWLGTINWVSSDVLFNGGYDGNNDLRFTGTVIESL